MDRPYPSYSVEDLRRFQAELDRARAYQIGGLILVVLAAVLALVARATGNAVLGLSFSFWGPLAAALLVGKLLFLFFAWRCPACGARLGPTYSPRYCSGCRAELRPTHSP
jgi:hypothetical protein